MESRIGRKTNIKVIVNFRDRQKECPACLGECDEEIHKATVSVRTWFREQVTRYLDPESGESEV